MENTIRFKDEDHDNIIVNCDNFDDGVWLRISRRCGSMYVVMPRDKAAELRDALNAILAAEVTA